MTVLKAVAVLSSLLCAAAIHAAPTATVMGLSMGEPLTISTTETCKYAAAKLCLEPDATSREHFHIRNPPDLGFEYVGFLDTFQGRLIQIGLNFPNVEFERAIAVLSEKYGKPSKESTSEFVAQGGAKFPSRLVEWNLGRLLVVAIERNTHRDAGHVAFIDLPLFVETRRLQKERDAAAAANL